MAASTSSTFQVTCPCGCGDIVTARDAGFSATTVDIVACNTLIERGFVLVTIRKSRAIELAAPNAHAPVRHRDGLVVLS